MLVKIKEWFTKTFGGDIATKATAEDIELAKALDEANIKAANEAINKAKPVRKRKKKTD